MKKKRVKRTLIPFLNLMPIQFKFLRMAWLGSHILPGILRPATRLVPWDSLSSEVVTAE